MNSALPTSQPSRLTTRLTTWFSTVFRNRASAAAAASGRAAGRFEPLEQRVVFNVPDNHTILKFETTYGNVYFELFNDSAPITVNNFLNYVQTARLDNTIFHRMVKTATGGIDILQGGGFTFKNGDGTPKAITADAPIVLENTGKSNLKGTLAMARTSTPNSATSQFFINTRDNVALDTAGGGYAVFGKIIGSDKAVEDIFALRTFDLDPAPQSLYDTVPVTAAFEQNQTGVFEEDLVYLKKARVIDKAEYRAVASTLVGGAVNNLDQLLISALGANGKPLVFSPTSNGGWDYDDLKTATGSPDITGNVVAFYDTKTGLAYAAGNSSQGLILFTRAANGTWTFTNLTTTLTGAKSPGTNITAFTAVDSMIHIAGVAPDGDVVLYRQQGTSTNFAWDFENLSDDHLAVRGLSTPAFTGTLTSYVQEWNGLNIVGLDTNGDVQAVWWAPGIDQNLWTTSNLTQLTNAPKLAGGLSVYLVPWQTTISGLSQTGEVLVVWWQPNAMTTWATSNMSQLFSGPRLRAGSISSWSTAWNSMQIAGIDETTGNLTMYWWSSAVGANWVITDMSTVLPADAKDPSGKLAGVPSTGSTINVVGTASNGDVVRYWWSPTTNAWKYDNVSILSIYG